MAGSLFVIDPQWEVEWGEETVKNGDVHLDFSTGRWLLLLTLFNCLPCAWHYTQHYACVLFELHDNSMRGSTITHIWERRKLRHKGVECPKSST